MFEPLVVYLTGVSGFVSANMYMKMSGERWVANVNLTSALFTCKLYVCVDFEVFCIMC